MRNLLRRAPIRVKLIAVTLTTSTIVLVLASLGFLYSDYRVTRQQLEADVEAQAEFILDNSVAALQFFDKDAALETLGTLRTRPNVRLACLYDNEGRLFTSYRYPGETAECDPHPPSEPGTELLGDRLRHLRTGVLDGRPFGSLAIISDLQTLSQRGRTQLVWVAFLLVLALGVAVVLSSALQSVVSAPLTSLARTARDVSARGDYSLRATRSTDDELGVVVDAFNGMLERIEAREADLSQANEELRREVAERRRAEQARAELLVREREANRLKDEFLATLSHELRTPLNAILGWTKLLRSRAVPADAVERALEKVERNAHVQSRLIEDLLEVSRIVSGKLRLEHRAFDLVALANTALDSIRPAAEGRGVEIHRRFSDPSLATAGDPDRLQQVIWNLLSNAVKFTPAGGSVTLSIDRRDTVDEIVVTDTGAGIDPAFLPNVFETFRQADASTTRTHGGLGLGLSIVKRLVEMHGGQVRAASDGPGRGAQFTVTLPVRTLRPPAEDSASAAAWPVGTRLTGRDVLVVDDDGDTRELLQTALTQAGAHVRVAASAPEGLVLAVERTPDALVSDIAMPGKDGYALVDELIRIQGPRAPRVRIALSAFAAAQDQERSLAAGFQHHIVKPVDPGVLVRLVADLLENEPELAP